MLKDIINKIYNYINRFSNPLKASLIYGGSLTFLLIILTFGLVIDRIFDLQNTPIPVIEFSNIFVLFITFGAIIWYTLETKDLKDLQKKQIKISITPTLILFKRHEPIFGDIDILKNIGRGVAKDIKIDDFVDDDHVRFIFDVEKVLGPGQEIRVMNKRIVNSSELDGVSSFIGYIRFREVVFNISFTDIDNGSYNQSLEISKNKVNLMTRPFY